MPDVSQSVPLLDIMTGSGNQIQTQFWENYQPLESQMEWPNMSTPTTYNWILWKQVLTEALHLGQNQKPANPLGMWNYQHDQQGWYYHHATNSLWEATNLQLMIYGGIPQCTRQQAFHKQGQINQPPPTTELEGNDNKMRRKMDITWELQV